MAEVKGWVRILCALAVIGSGLAGGTGCSLQPPAKSPTADMGLPAPEGYPNRDAAARNADGIDHLVREHWRKAAADFRRALEADPNLAVAHFNLALSLDEIGDHDQATAHFRMALERAPDDPRIAENPCLRASLNP